MTSTNLEPGEHQLLGTADYWAVNSSGGKDSQAMLSHVVAYAVSSGYPLDRVVVVHANLGRVEWPGALELVHEHAAHYGLRVHTAKRRTAQGELQDLLEHVEARGRWPSPTARYCTSDHKRDPLAGVVRRLASEARGRHRDRECHQATIVNCLGFRSQESPARAKRTRFSLDTRLSCGNRSVYQWLPIHGWSVDDVLAENAGSGLRTHPAYSLGMPRLSCVFCIYAPRAALLLAGRLNPELLQAYVDVERRTGHRFRQDLAIADVQAELAADPRAGTEKPSDWNM